MANDPYTLPADVVLAARTITERNEREAQARMGRELAGLFNEMLGTDPALATAMQEAEMALRANLPEATRKMIEALDADTARLRAEGKKLSDDPAARANLVALVQDPAYNAAIEEMMSGIFGEAGTSPAPRTRQAAPKAP